MVLEENELRMFTGTEQYHKLTIFPIKCTDGVAYVAKEASAYWLIDAIGSHQPNKKLRFQEFQVWILEKAPKGWVLRCEDGNNHTLLTQKIPFSDFPLDKIKFFYQHGVLMLPSEY